MGASGTNGVFGLSIAGKSPMKPLESIYSLMHLYTYWSLYPIFWGVKNRWISIFNSPQKYISIKTRCSPRTRMLTRMLMAQMSKHMDMQSRRTLFCNSLFEQSCTYFPCYQSAVWSVECSVWSVKCRVWSVKCGVWSVKCRVRGVWGGKCRVWSVECGV